MSLLSSLKIGPYTLSHRVIMAPLTRMRASETERAPEDLNAEYYGQRASNGGLIIAEASQVMASGRGMPRTPGIHTQAQVAGWTKVTEAVHAKGGIIFLQLWHVGRISHSSHQPDGGKPTAPSAVQPAGQAFTSTFQREPFEMPRALENSEISGIVASYAEAARLAKAAGFDGVEIHGANGYLLEQFLQSRSNQRTDAYGGSIENRARLLLEVVEAVIGVWGAERVGVRLSPFGVANDSGEADPIPLYTYVIKKLADMKPCYLHFIEPRASGAGQAEVDHKDVPSAAELFRPLWPGTLIAAGNFRADSANAAIANGHADAIAFGRLFISNPDLPERIRTSRPLTPYDRATFYSSGPKGYTDYPLHA